MPEPYRPLLIPAGLKHPRVREFLAVKRQSAGRDFPGMVSLEGTWMLRQAMAVEVRLQAVFVCPARHGQAEGEYRLRKATARRPASRF